MSKSARGSVPYQFGRRVRTLRQKQGISQESLAELARVHRTYIGMVERGEKAVTIVTLLKLAKALGVTPADLLEEIKVGE